MKKPLLLLLAACLLVLTACGSERTRDFFAMDTAMRITAACDVELIERAEEKIKELDGKFSVTGETGEVFLLNRDGVLSNPSAELLELLECARVLYERTDGAYDITSYPLKLCWQACEDEGRMPTEQEISQALAKVGSDKLVFNEAAVTLSGGGALDLGSIAKGYAGKQACKVLTEGGAKHGILTLGGNIVTFGEKPDGQPYRIGITNPASPDSICGYVEVGNANIVTSGGYNRYMEIGGKRYNHIIDARTGMPCDNGVASVTVICTDGMWADALSTALFLLGEQGALEYYAEYGGFEAVIIMDDGRIVTTSDNITFVRK